MRTANGRFQPAERIQCAGFPNGQALMYRRMDGTFAKVPFVAHGKDAEIGAPQTYITSRPFAASPYGQTWDIAADGRVIVISLLGEATHTIDVVVNWTAGLKK